jgi:RHS repeat-associated protein
VQFISDLYTGYLQRLPDLGGADYWLGVLHTSPNTRANLIAAFAAAGEFSGNVNALCPAPGAAAGIYYALSDLQGSTRAMMNNQGTSSAVIARHDYLPFGEEIGSSIGFRSGGQGYGAGDTNRWKYGMLQRDAATGLDHTWWRKYESAAGRWTTPDPLGGSIGDPQSFNHYTYTGNDPVNSVDPTGLMCQVIWEGERYYIALCDHAGDSFGGGFAGGGGKGGGTGGGTAGKAPPKKTKTHPKYTSAQINSAINSCAENLFGITLIDFDPSSKGHNGSFTGRTIDGHQIAGNPQVHIVNATTSYTIAQLTAMSPHARGYVTVGLEHPGSPHRNFTASDREKIASEIVGVSSFVQTQIHELGNSLSDITGTHFSSSPKKRDQDEGQAFQDCIAGALKK